MRPDRFSATRSFPLAAAAALLTALALAGSGGAATPGCSSFRSQAAAQTYFAARGGGPGRAVGGLDGNRDGVACEGLAGPYKGFATIGYNRRKQFFFGVATMPPNATAGGFACLEGNRHFPDGPRQLDIYRVRSGGDRLVAADVAAEAQADRGQLIWKAVRGSIVPGTYYAEFEARIPLSPYGGNECPGFRSGATFLPPPQR